jgi:hypothetical protein
MSSGGGLTGDLNTIVDLWEAHTAMLTAAQVADPDTLKKHIVTFYERIVWDGFKGGPLNIDTVRVIASFLVPTVVPNAAVESVDADGDEGFGFRRGIELLVDAGKALVAQCFVTELKDYILDQARLAASADDTRITFKAGRHYTTTKGKGHSSFFRDWMLGRNECKDPQLYHQLAALHLDLPAVLTFHRPTGGMPYMQWQIDLPSRGGRMLVRRHMSPFV